MKAYIKGKTNLYKLKKREVIFENNEMRCQCFPNNDQETTYGENMQTNWDLKFSF